MQTSYLVSRVKECNASQKKAAVLSRSDAKWSILPSQGMQDELCNNGTNCTRWTNRSICVSFGKRNVPDAF